LDQVLDEVASAYEEKLAPAIPQIWRAEVQAIRADLRGWLQIKLAQEADWSPKASEYQFDVALPEGYLLKGRIDLVEQHPSGSMRVVDHKTGKPREPRPEMVGNGEALQPALYGLAAEVALGEEVSLGRLWYATIARNYEPVDVPLNQWTRRRALAVLERIDGAIADGYLPSAPRKDACKGCEYLVVCGPYEEERVKEKSQVELSGLRELRSWR
jgi:CRISPR/Cas system-associated exonuclease Cas4 (RecB family)